MYSIPKRYFFVDWYSDYGREFPWRGADTTPFEFLVTEILLRQTRAETVSKIWHDFIRKYKTPEAIGSSKIDELTNDIKVFGFYNQRARDLKNIAEWVIEKHHGLLPESEELLIEIPGVGLYSARATLCFAYKKRTAIVDTNIIRFLSRYFGIEYKYPDIRRNRWAWEIAETMLPKNDKRVFEHNYGLLDFTGTVCTARRSQHEKCPLAKTCKLINQTMKD